MAHEKMRISECPLCGNSHQYLLEVERKIISGLATQPQAFRQVSYQRAFPCPTTGGQFEGSIKLSETTLKPIVSVKVVNLDEEE